jgi:PAS domain S-box-containing protein
LGLATARDVTERRQAQEILDRFFRLAPDLFCIASADGFFLKLNPAWEQALGFSRAELMAAPFLHFVHPDDRDATRAVSVALRNGDLTGFENRYRHKDGGYRWLSWRASFLDELFYGVARDVTGSKEAERALEQARDAAEVASRAKSAFLANMSHEMRTPLTAILGFADVLLEDESILRAPAERLEDLRIIQQNGRHLLELIDDILDLARVEAGRTVVRRVACDPGRIAADVAAALRVRSAEKGLGLDVEFATPVPVTIRTDPVRLRQILMNLVGNAIKFTEAGGVRLRLGLDGAGDPEPVLWFEVIDTGIGMTPAELGNLFRPFCRADLPASRKAGGTGLGLAISKRLAELLGGSIAVQTLPGGGSTFRLTIAAGPLEGGAPWRPPGDGDRPAPAAERPPARPAPARLDRRILLAEDNPANQRSSPSAWGGPAPP